MNNKKGEQNHGKKLLEQYFYDIYGIFMKKLSVFVLESEVSVIEHVRLTAMLREMIKIKKILAEKSHV